MKVCFIERGISDTPSIERVFAQISKDLNALGVETQSVKLPYGNRLTGILGNLIFFRTPKADIYHITGHAHYIALKMPTDSTVLTVHDLGLLRMRSGIRRAVLKRLFFDWPFRRVKYLTAVSEATKSDILANCPDRPADVLVIGNPIAEDFAGEMSGFKEDEPLILQIGTAPHKNLKNLIKAVSGLRCRLLIIGKIDEARRNELSQAGVSYENIATASDTEMRRAYERCDIVAFCSKFEGFGLPVIEAQAMKRPLVTSNIAPMKDVAGEGAALVNPDDPLSIRTALEKIICDDNYRGELIDKGTANIRRFDGAKIASEYLRLYDKVCAGRS